MTASEFKAHIKKLSSGYLFCGEEEYLKRYYLKEARSALVDEGDVFNRIVINEENYSPSFLFSSLEALPIMAEKKLIEISSININEMSESSLDELISVLERLKDYEYNVLIMSLEVSELDIGTKKQPSKAFSSLSKVLTPVVFDKESPSKLITWAGKHFTKELIVAPPDALSLLVQRSGADMTALSNEIDKLVCYLKANDRDRLTLQDVIDISSERKDIEAFELANAILDGNIQGAFSVLNEMKKRKERPEIILSGIARVISDLNVVKCLLDSGLNSQDIEKTLRFHSYKVSLYMRSASKTDMQRLKKVNTDCYEADLLIKSTSVNAYTVLERLAVEAARR